MTRHNHRILHGLLLATASTLPLTAQDFRAVGTLTPTGFDSGTFYRKDFNGNGVDDVVVVSFSSVSTLIDPTLTMTSGTFNSVMSNAQFSGGIFDATFFEDFNNDGNLDIGIEVLGLFFSNALFAYVPGDGQGAFGSPVTIQTASSKVGQMTVGDYNGDGQPDLAFWDFPTGASAFMTIYLQNNGVYTAAHSYTQTSAVFPDGMVAGDFNGDGFDDICWLESGVLTTVLGTNGAFAAPRTQSVSVDLNNTFAKDLDQDGYEDLVAQSAGSSGWDVDVFWGDPTTVHSAPQHVVTMPPPTRSDFIGPFDVDSDGNDELLVLIRGVGAYDLLRHDGARTFSPTPYRTTMGGGLVDLDQDGDLDMMTATLSRTYEIEENLARYGVPCSGAAGAPWLAVGPAIPGTAVQVTLRNAAPNVLAQVLISPVANIQPVCGPQIALGQLLFPYSGGSFFWSRTDSAGTLSYSFPIPRNAPDGPYFLQGIVVDPQGAFSGPGIALSATGGRAVRVY